MLSLNRSLIGRTSARGRSLALRSPGVWPIVAGLIGTLLFLAGGNWLVDPYYLGSGLQLTGFNALKPEAFDYSRLWKPYAVADYGAEILILGTSSVEAGLDPEYEGWQYHPVFNAGFGAAHPYEVMRLFQHAVSVAKPRQAVLGLDFTTYLTYDEKLPVRFNEARLAVDRDMRPTPRSQREHAHQLLFTPSMLRSSWRTLQYQDERAYGVRDAYPRQIVLANGARAPLGSERRMETYGADDVFDMSVEYVSKRFGGIAPALGRARMDPGNALVGYTRKLIELAHARDVDLIIVMPPCQVSHLEVVARTGHAGAFARFKQTFVDMNIEVAAQYGRKPFRLFDYCFPSRLAESRTLTLDGKAEIAFFDTAHFSFEIGNRMISSWFDPEKATIPSDDVRTYRSGEEARSLAEQDFDRLMVSPLPSHPT